MVRPCEVLTCIAQAAAGRSYCAAHQALLDIQHDDWKKPRSKRSRRPKFRTEGTLTAVQFWLVPQAGDRR